MGDYADISPCGRYRYRLDRKFIGAGPTVVFCMLNPSTADAENNDPTIRRCIGFARREGAGKLVVVNLFAGRATKPDELFKMDDPTGPRNEHAWESALDGRNEIIIAAWGADKRAKRAGDRFRAWARMWGRELYCLGKTQAGAPRHPLYLKNDAARELYGRSLQEQPHD